MAVENVVCRGVYMDTNASERTLSVLESLRQELAYVRLNNGGRVLDVADLRQYIYEQISRSGQPASQWMDCTATTVTMGKISAREVVTMEKRIWGRRERKK